MDSEIFLDKVVTEDKVATEPKSVVEDAVAPEDELVVEFDFDTSVVGSGQIDIEVDESVVAPTEGEYTATATAEGHASVATEGTPTKTHMSQRTKNTITNTIIHVVLVVMCVLWVLPFVFILFESFRTESTGLAGYIIPKQFGFDNYVRLFTETQFPKWFLSTLIMGLITAIVQTVFILCVSYALSRNRFKGRKALMNVMLILGMFPGFLTLILLYQLLKMLGLTGANAPWGLIILYVASSGMGYHVSKGFFDTVSRSLDEAALVDGATRFQIFYKIILPLCKPIVIYTILMGFMAPWGDFVTAAFMADNVSSGYNVATGLYYLIDGQNKATYYTTFCAGGVVVAVPITTLFMFLQKYYVAGVTGGAVKG